MLALKDKMRSRLDKEIKTWPDYRRFVIETHLRLDKKLRRVRVLRFPTRINPYARVKN